MQKFFELKFFHLSFFFNNRNIFAAFFVTGAYLRKNFPLTENALFCAAYCVE